MPRHLRGKNRHRFIYLIRHGDYEYSDEHFGGVLNDHGIEQAACLAEPMGRVPVDAIYSSTMHRAYQTAEILREQVFPDLTVRRTPILKERIFPGWFTGDQIDHEAEDKSREVLEKVWERFFRPSRSERHDVLVCHGNIIRALITRVLDAPIDCWTKAVIANCGITQVICLGDGRVRLLSFNERGHLPYRLRLFGRGVKLI